MTSLSNYFKGNASKYLSAVDATRASNQHEIGSKKFTAFLGDPGDRKLRFNATFLHFKQDSDEPEVCSDEVTYYDSRLKQTDRSPEYRLYYRDNPITKQFQEGNFCLVGARTTGELLIAIAPAGSDHERRLRYLFDVRDLPRKWAISQSVSSNELNLATRSILNALQIEILDEGAALLDSIVSKFGLKFPPTKDFSAFARETVTTQINAQDNPDTALEEWMKQEERLFRALENAIVQIELDKKFTSTNAFISFSLSVQNRRKSRVGHALENHLEAVFKASKIPYQRGKKTEGNSKPDFIFPSAKAYHDLTVGSPPLQMLAAKSTCKDRWRQILTEAERIPTKHLFTLETAISESQTAEMKRHGVQLVVPPSVAKTFTAAQQIDLLSLEGLLTVLRR